MFKFIFGCLLLASLVSITIVIDNQYKFQVGDCFIDKEAEEWDLDKVCEIKKIGKRKYLFECPLNAKISYSGVSEVKARKLKDESIELIDANNKKTPCL